MNKIEVEKNKADLSEANLYGADLSRADLSEANLYGANLSRADLSEANLYGADLYGADLSGADLRGADLSGADLRGAKGIYSFGPIGGSQRIGYAWLEKGHAVFGLGCHFGNLKDTVKAIRAKYGRGSTYEAQVVLAAKILEAE